MKSKLLAVIFALATTTFAGGLPFAGAFTLDRLVLPISELPASAQNAILDASTYWEQIPKAAKFAVANPSVDPVVRDAAAASLNLDPSVAALLTQPALLKVMAGNMVWTARLGQAVILQRADVTAALERLHSAPAN